MIRSGVFTFDESSIWDPKIVREYLNIPEDQLNILRNLPEWSEDTDNNTFRIGKDSICENSQSTKCTADTTLERNSNVNKQKNIALFDENFELRRKILDRCRLNAAKLSRSISLLEIDKIGKISSSSSPLKSSSSVPDLYLFSESSCLKYLHSEFRNKDSLPERHSTSLIKSINLSVTKQEGKTCISVQTNTGISKRKGETYIEKSKMEVDSQLPVAIPCYVDEFRNNETHTGILVENNTVLTSLTLKSPNKLNLSPNNESISSVTNADKFGNSCSIEIKASKLPKPDSPNLCDKNEIDIVKEPITSNNCNPDVSKKNTKLAEQDGSVSWENDELDVVTVEVNTSIENERIETNMDFHESVKANETIDQCSGSLIISKEVCAAETNKVSSDEPENHIFSDSNYRKIEVQNGQQTIHQNISDNKLDFTQTLSIKRKLESKNRSSKRRKNTQEKQGLEKRSLKKAGEICYTAEHIKTMLDLMGQFS